jgi:hypothetical protein
MESIAFFSLNVTNAIKENIPGRIPSTPGIISHESMNMDIGNTRFPSNVNHIPPRNLVGINILGQQLASEDCTQGLIFMIIDMCTKCQPSRCDSIHAVNMIQVPNKSFPGLICFKRSTPDPASLENILKMKGNSFSDPLPGTLYHWMDGK